MSGALESMKETLDAYGYPSPTIIFTDKPQEDANFFKENLLSVASMEKKLQSTLIVSM